MAETLVDTNVFVAAFNGSDALHSRAVKALAAIERPYILHEYVALETATVLMMRVSKAAADIFIQGALHNAEFRLVLSSETGFQRTAKTFVLNRSKLSFTDTALLALSSDYDVLTFDEALNRAIKRKAA